MLSDQVGDRGQAPGEHVDVVGDQADHGAQRSVGAVRGDRPQHGLGTLLVGVAPPAVHVQVHESRDQGQPRGVDHLGPLRVLGPPLPPAGGGDAPVAHRDPRVVDRPARVDRARGADHQGCAGAHRRPAGALT